MSPALLGTVCAVKSPLPKPISPLPASPDKIVTANLNVESVFLDDRNALVSFPENSEFFEAPKEGAFKAMLAVNAPEWVDANAEVPEEFDSSYIYLAATPTSTGAVFFGVTHGDVVRIVGAGIATKSRTRLETGIGRLSRHCRPKVFLKKNKFEK